jgi:hypothetical protein
MDSYDLSEQRIVQLEQIPVDIQRQIEKGDSTEYALDLSLNRLRSIDQIGAFEHVSQVRSFGLLEGCNIFTSVGLLCSWICLGINWKASMESKGFGGCRAWTSLGTASPVSS